MVIFYVGLIDNISSETVPLEKRVVIHGANAFLLLAVVLFILSKMFICDFFHLVFIS